MRTPTKVAVVAMALALLSIALARAQEGKAVEPEYASVFYFLRAGKLVDLERKTPDESSKGRNFVLIIQGEKSAVRFSPDEGMRFVVRVTESYEKAVPTVQLFRFEPQNGKRQLLLKKSNFISNADSLALRVEKYGNSSLMVVPSSQLGPGEYCISRTTITNGYCFGIDAAEK